MDSEEQPQTLEERAFELGVYSRHLPDEPEPIDQTFRDNYNLGVNVRVIWRDMGYLKARIVQLCNTCRVMAEASEDVYKSDYAYVEKEYNRAKALFENLSQIENQHPELSRVIELPAGTVYSIFGDIEREFKELKKPKEKPT